MKFLSLFFLLLLFEPIDSKAQQINSRLKPITTVKHLFTNAKELPDHYKRDSQPEIFQNSLKYQYNNHLNINEERLKVNDKMFRPVIMIADTVNKDTYTYDNNNLLTDLFQVLENGVWENYSRDTFNYDKNGNKLSDLYEDWVNGTWVNYSRLTHTYDNDGNRLTDLFERWKNGAWVISSKYTYTYDTKGNELAYLHETWTNGGWENSSKETYTYDNSGNELTWTYEQWSNGAWINSARGTHTYDTTGKELIYLRENWSNGIWENYSKGTHTYNTKENTLVDLTEVWQDSAWKNYFRDTYTYDNNGNELSYLNEKWTNNAWGNDSKMTYTYDSYGNAIKGESFWWMDGNWEYFRSELSLSYNNGTDYIYPICSIATVEYETVITDVQNPKPTAHEFSLSQNYPNPFNPRTSIKFSIPKRAYVNLSIYNSMGQEVANLVSQDMNAGAYSTEWNALGFASGIYFYRIIADNFSETKKLLLLK
ncbi:MAG: T9SS type A sorting domain-containing protein [Bacteroidota bacterium]|nr:T9SS type A sorting domain-containing protein [Bacteroidota bacterium]